MPILAGDDAWYEMTVKNATSSDQTLDLSTVRVTGATFVDSNGSDGFVEGVVGDKISAQKCLDWSALVVIRPGEALTTLIKVTAPKGKEGDVSVRLDVTLMRITDLRNCTAEPVVATSRFSIRMQPSGDPK
jgi:hypothetical protein